MDSETEKPHAKATNDSTAKLLRRILALVVAAMVVGFGWLGYAYVFSPVAVRQPQQAHYHFRIQLVNGGNTINFAEPAYQTEFNKDSCSALLTKEPFHFHDQLDQFVHVHWSQVTGGMWLKHYGWNFIGGSDKTLGYRFDQLPRLERIPIHGKTLPKPPVNAHYYVYTGSASSYRERTWNEFLTTDLRQFFTGQPQANTNFWDRLVPAAQAHAGHDHAASPSPSNGTTPAAAEEARLTRLNDVLGSVVIFAQADKPTEAQVKDRFDRLVPLPLSSCGG